MSKFYCFRQNNSGGQFIGERDLIIEAESAEEANEIALDNGVYFDGVEESIDCDCCGDRWYRVEEHECDVRDFPHVWGNPVEKSNCSYKIIKKEQV
jgi:hypothetical protein